MSSQIPIVSFDGIAYEITLFHDAGVKEEKHIFGEHALSVCSAHKDDFQGRTLAPQIKGPPADDGFLYYLYAQPEDVGRPSFVWLKDKEEAVALRKAISEAEELHDGWRHDSKCTFCGAMVSECGEDHGDEMRQIMREQLRRH
jgi:hypothetical protein